MFQCKYRTVFIECTKFRFSIRNIRTTLNSTVVCKKCIQTSLIKLKSMEVGSNT